MQSIACGPDHTLFVNGNGQLFSCGCNDFGQLGHEQPRKRPRMSKFRMWDDSHSSIFIFSTKLVICMGTQFDIQMHFPATFFLLESSSSFGFFVMHLSFIDTDSAYVAI